MRVVIRLECKDGLGPYTGDAGEWRNRRLRNMDIVYSDIGWNAVTYKHYCGFLSPQELYRWTSKLDRRQAEDDGYFVAVYLCPEEHVLEGRHQVAFVRDKATLVERITPTQFWRKRNVVAALS